MVPSYTSQLYAMNCRISYLFRSSSVDSIWIRVSQLRCYREPLHFPAEALPFSIYRFALSSIGLSVWRQVAMIVSILDQSFWAQMAMIVCPTPVILPYLDAPLLDVNICYYHFVVVEGFVLFFLDHPEGFTDLYSSRVTGTVGWLHQQALFGDDLGLFPKPSLFLQLR